MRSCASGYKLSSLTRTHVECLAPFGEAARARIRMEMDVVVAGAKSFVGGLLGGAGPAGEAAAAAMKGEAMNKLNGMLPGPVKEGLGLVQGSLGNALGALPAPPPGTDSMGQ